MKNARVLVILNDEYLTDFFLFEVVDSSLKLHSSKRLRIYRDSYGFSLVDYLLEALSLWGDEIGIPLVKEKVPIVPQTDGKGVEDIFLITYKRESDLDAITKKVYVASKHIQKEGAQGTVRFLTFKNLIYVCLGTSKTSIIRFREDRKGVMKVVSEGLPFDLKQYFQSDAFDQWVKYSGDLIKKGDITNLLLNNIQNPVFNIHSLPGALLEYFVSYSTLYKFSAYKKLDLQSFGEGGFEDNILIIGGQKTRIGNNVPLHLLSIITALGLHGNFSVYYDEYGLFDFLQKTREQVLSDTLLSKYLLSYWGNVLSLDAGRKRKLDEIVADIEINDGSSERQMIPMYGRILSFTFLDKGNITIETRKGFSLGQKKSRKLYVEDAQGHFVVDAREKPFESVFEKENVSEILESWFKGMEIIHSY